MNIKNYSKQTQNLITSVNDYLSKKYGGVNPEWETILMLLCDNLELYKACKRSVKENGIYNGENGRKNPLLTTMKDLQATILKQIQHLGLSPYAVSKIKGDDEDTTDNYINDLVTNSDE